MFREDFLKARHPQWQGSILLTQPLSSWLLTALAALITLAILAYLFFGAYTRRVTATGLLLPEDGIVSIMPPAAAIVVEKRVREGQVVHKGDVLFILSDERSPVVSAQAQMPGEAQSRSLAQRRHALLQTGDAQRLQTEKNLEGLKEKQQLLERELDSGTQQIALQEERIASATLTLQRYRALQERHYVSELELQEKQEALTARQEERLDLQRQQAQTRRLLLEVSADIRQTPLRQQQLQASTRQDLGELEQDAAEWQVRNRYAITAPMAGTITSITAQQGQLANGQALASLLPENSALVARLLLPSRAIGFVEAGQNVRIRYQAYPYQKFGQHQGVVTEVTRSPVQTGDMAAANPAAGSEAVYRVTVRLQAQYIRQHDTRMPLKPGMVVEADIEQERRRLIEWIIEPLYKIRNYLG